MFDTYVLYGTLKKRPFCGQFDIPVDGWEDTPQIALRKASMWQSPQMWPLKYAAIADIVTIGGVHVVRLAWHVLHTAMHNAQNCKNKDHSEEDKKDNNHAESSKVQQQSNELNKQSEQCQCRHGCHGKKSCPCKMKGALCTKACHPQHHCTNILTSDKKNTSIFVDLSNQQSSMRTSNEQSKDKPEFWQDCCGKHLYKSHKDAIRTGKWLCDEVINASQLLLKNQHPSIGGFQSTLLANLLAMDPQKNKEFIQILNVSNNHWITVSTIGCPPSTIDVYDSMHLKLPTNSKKVVADIMQSPSDKITIR